MFPLCKFFHIPCQHLHRGYALLKNIEINRGLTRTEHSQPIDSRIHVYIPDFNCLLILPIPPSRPQHINADFLEDILLDNIY